eukprot:gene3556-3758_t
MRAPRPTLPAPPDDSLATTSCAICSMPERSPPAAA